MFIIGELNYFLSRIEEVTIGRQGEFPKNAVSITTGENLPS